MTKNCTNCFFYCHTDGRCYADPRSACDEDYALKLNLVTACCDWVFDGLEDWERETVEVMEVTK